MQNNSLLLIDLKKNLNITETNQYFINLNYGSINLEKCSQYFLKDYKDFREKIYSQLVNNLKQKIESNEKFKFFFSEMELFNLRNDRYQYFDRIINLNIVKKIIIDKKINKIKIISDNKLTLNIFDNMNIEVEKKNIGSGFNNFSYLKLKIIKFYFKTLFLLLYIKLKGNNRIIKKGKIFFMSIYPNRYFYGKKNLYNKENNIFNFLLSDETHLNHSFIDLVDNVKETKKKGIINIEEFIYISDILILIFKIIFNFNIYKQIDLQKISFNNLNFEDELKELTLGSFINRSKLDIYNKALPRFLAAYKVNKISLYLFEYSFGFYLIRSIKQFSKKILICGYQHGIFTKNLMWYDLIIKSNLKQYYMPHKIICSNKFTRLDYKKKTKIKEISIIKVSKKLKKFKTPNLLKIHKRSKNILVLPGTHDIKDMYFFIKNNKLQENKIYCFKLHPKNKFNFKPCKNIIKINDFFNKKFSNIIISQTSSIIHDFLTVGKKFSIIDLDYKQNILPDQLSRGINKLNLKS